MKDSEQTSQGVTLVLASGSPRRRELIKALDMPVELSRPDGDEGSPRSGETPEEYVLRLSLDKAKQILDRYADSVIIGADTVVVLNEEVLGKPANDAGATAMLQRLRGVAHTVLTGVTVFDSRTGHWESMVKSTDVLMRRYSDMEIAAYVKTGGSLDKAGGYAIQDDGFRPTRSIQGCYLNVVGFPLCEVIRLLDELCVHATLKSDWQPPEQCRDCALRKT
ncbi:MAG: septum formation protein Maf [Chloroflexi bacterium]|nr:septum formation protein Maf [Chloroflexota bacterium]